MHLSGISGPNGAHEHIRAEPQQPNKEPPAKDFRLKILADMLPKKHACKRRQQCEERASSYRGLKRSAGQQAGAKCERRYSERQAKGLDQFFLVHSERVEIGNRWNDEHSGSSSEHPREETNCR